MNTSGGGGAVALWARRVLADRKDGSAWAGLVRALHAVGGVEDAYAVIDEATRYVGRRWGREAALALGAHPFEQAGRPFARLAPPWSGMFQGAPTRHRAQAPPVND